MKSALTGLLITIVILSIQAQASGYQGKRFILKTDLSSLVDRGGSGSIEVAIGRHLSIEPEYRFYNRKNIKYTSYDSDNFTNYDCEAAIREHAAFLMMKFYTSRSYCAPKGFYSFVQAGMGIADIQASGLFYNFGDSIGGSDPLEPDPQSDYILRDFTLNNVTTVHATIGVGVNYIFAKRIVADIAWGVHYARMFTKPYHTGAYANRFGPNVVSFIPATETTSDPFAKNVGIGFMFRAAIGFLIF